jgi:hypothetical protein
MSMIAESETVIRERIQWTELNCFTCGEVAGYVENQRVVRPVLPGRIRPERGRLGCGRCGGMLLAGACGTSTSQAGIG